jgi:dihydroneopterin aldolase
MRSDRIILSGIEFYAYGGVTTAEKEIGQRYRASIELELDLRAAGASDAIEDTVSYADVYAVAVNAARELSFNLIESVAERVARRLLDSFPVQAVTLRVEKLLPPIDGVVASASVEITRSRGE